jgi:hypothetical protein
LKKSRTKEILVPDILGEREKIKESERNTGFGYLVGRFMIRI